MTVLESPAALLALYFSAFIQSTNWGEGCLSATYPDLEQIQLIPDKVFCDDGD